MIYFQHPHIGIKTQTELETWYGPTWGLLATQDGWREIPAKNKYAILFETKLKGLDFEGTKITQKNITSIFLSLTAYIKSNHTWTWDDIEDLAILTYEHIEAHANKNTN